MKSIIFRIGEYIHVFKIEKIEKLLKMKKIILKKRCMLKGSMVANVY